MMKKSNTRRTSNTTAKPLLNLYKKPGETPLQCLDRFRRAHPEYAHTPLSYVGRLDPMAEGVLLVVTGEENKNRSSYLGLSKEYVVEILFGVSTDTGDCMGIITGFDVNPIPYDFESILSRELKNFVGNINQPYPHYSSKTVSGKPLFEWAREGRIDEINIPTKTVSISSIELLNLKQISASDLLAEIKRKIALVHGDFRQEKIVDVWHRYLGDFLSENHQFTIATIKVNSGAGAYMRFLAEAVGKSLKKPALAFHITRTKVGKFGTFSNKVIKSAT